MTTAGNQEMHKYQQVMARVRAQVEDGTLPPGALAPSGAALARMTGFSALTCLRALEALLKAGVLVPGSSHTARLRVAGLRSDQEEVDTAGRALAADLSSRRRAMGLSQPRLAGLLHVSITSIGHAETGRLWQSRRFWERADVILMAEGELLRLHDAYRSATAAATPAGGTRDAPAPGRDGGVAPVNRTAAVNGWAAGSASVVDPDPAGLAQALRAARIKPPPGQSASAVIVVWTDGTVATLNPAEDTVNTTPPLPAPGQCHWLK
jgi:DNA-binding transcriptional regulator YhcF (GntR family)